MKMLIGVLIGIHFALLGALMAQADYAAEKLRRLRCADEPQPIWAAR